MCGLMHAYDFSKLEIPPNELKAAIVLFYSLLDEQQRRLYAGLESLRLGRGGDVQLGDFLGIGFYSRFFLEPEKGPIFCV
jgi:hypothetical protein